jgi:predicted MPP superfamily phosphohydrolase
VLWEKNVLFALFLGIWTVLNWYVFWRISSLPWVARHLPKPAMLAIALLLWSAYLLGRTLIASGAARLGRAMEVIGANWIGVVFLLFTALLLADLVTGFGWLWPRIAVSVRSCALLASLLLCAIAFVQAMRPPVVTPYEVHLANLPAERDGTVVVVASDLHLGDVLGEGWLAARRRQMEAEKPDLILLAGDIIDGTGPAQQALLPEMRRLTAPLGVWAVLGNHEFFGSGANASAALLQRAGYNVLRDRWTEVSPGLVLAGVDDLTIRRRGAQQLATFVDHTLAGIPANTATLFLSHSPLQAEAAARHGAGLMISGHTHNGQIWPFTYVVAAFYSQMAGRYEIVGMPTIVCRGTGTWGPRMRLWQRGEILKITLRS